MLQNPDGARRRYVCVMLQRKEIEATAAAMSDISEEEFGVPCLVCSHINSMESARCEACGQDLSILGVDEDGETTTTPTAAEKESSPGEAPT